MKPYSHPPGQVGVVVLIDGNRFPATLDNEAIHLLSPRDAGTGKWHRYGPQATAQLVAKHWVPGMDEDVWTPSVLCSCESGRGVAQCLAHRDYDPTDAELLRTVSRGLS